MPRNGFFGVKNSHFALCTDEDALTYLKPYAVPGTVEVKATPSVQNAKSYADNEVWSDDDCDNGGSGTLSMRDVESTPELRKLLALICGFDIDEAGHVLGSANKERMPFAFMCQQEGKAVSKRRCYYMCRASKPSLDAKTIEDKLDITQLDIDFDWKPVTLPSGWRGNHYDSYSDLSDYDKFFEKVKTDLKPVEIDAATVFGAATASEA